MSTSQEHDNGKLNLLELEAQTHGAMTPMINAHVETSSGKVCDLGYDRDRYVYQRLDEAYTPPADKLYGIPIKVIPSRVVIGGMHASLATHLRSVRKANKMVKAFRDTQAYEGSDYSIAEDIERRLCNGEAVATINDHLKRGDLRDVALIVGGIGISINQKWVRDRSVVLLGENISREGYGKKRKPKVEQITQGMGIVWVMQNTNNRKELDIRPEAVKIANDGASEAIDNLREDGVLAGIVPAGSTTLLISDDSGEYYHRPPTRSSVSTLAGFDAVLDVAMKDGEILPGQIHATETLGLSDREKLKRRLELVDSALVSLALKNAELTGTPLVFERVNKKWSRAEPNGELSLAAQ